MFQPAEEIFEGAKDMLQAGLLENPKVNAALMIHVIAAMPLSPGTIVVSEPGISAPAADYFEITVQGKGCHGSMPGTGIDPVNAAAHILISLQEIQTRELSAGDRAVLTIGTIQVGTAISRPIQRNCWDKTKPFLVCKSLRKRLVLRILPM